jgi:hypothetical protein
MTQYKWLPKMPTAKMLESVDANIKPAVVSIYERMWISVPESSQSPSFYRYSTTDGFGDTTFHTTNRKPTSEVSNLTPLYTHPPKPESISDIDIEKLYQNLSCDISIDQLKEIVGMIESFSRN